ncbi:MAG: hypothetical protein HQ481_05610, partial [Alphaproteobacteria bacterium]|nr:hypothetical protein [Alphaproteobacteria bacterium]
MNQRLPTVAPDQGRARSMALPNERLSLVVDVDEHGVAPLIVNSDDRLSI